MSKFCLLSDSMTIINIDKVAYIEVDILQGKYTVDCHLTDGTVVNLATVGTKEEAMTLLERYQEEFNNMGFE